MGKYTEADEIEEVHHLCMYRDTGWGGSACGEVCLPGNTYCYKHGGQPVSSLQKQRLITEAELLLKCHAYGGFKTEEQTHAESNLLATAYDELKKQLKEAQEEISKPKKQQEQAKKLEQQLKKSQKEVRELKKSNKELKEKLEELQASIRNARFELPFD